MHDRLAPDFQNLGVDPRQLQRNGPDRARIRCDILTDNTVASGRGGNENPLFIPEIDREPVKLQLRNVFDRRIFWFQT
ncbi:unknown [Sutterella sp. CAG:351]|nr:unknown [Sutterella sp. CAG:351]